MTEYDERTVNDTEQDGAGANPEGSQGQTEQASPATNASATPDYDSIITARIQAIVPSLRDELKQELIRTNQSDEDRLLNRLQKRLGAKLPLYAEVGKELGMDDAAIQERQNLAVINELRAASVPQPTPEAQPQYPYQPVPTSPPYAATTINEPEIIAALAAEGLEPKDVNYADLLGKAKGTPDVMDAWDERVTLAKAAKIQAKQQAKLNQQAAKPIAQIRSETGSIGSPSGGAPSAGYNAEQELAKMNAQEPPDHPIERAKWERRMEKLYAEAYPKR